MNVRFARPTNRLSALEEFYCKALGFTKVGSFTGHEGFDGVMLAYPGTDWHLEFTSQDGAVAPACPSREHLIVLYLSTDECRTAAERLARLGIVAVRPHNPYWEKQGAVTVEDPDGYGVILCPNEHQS